MKPGVSSVLAIVMSICVGTPAQTPGAEGSLAGSTSNRPARVSLSERAKAALAEASAEAGAVKGLRGAARLESLERAAVKYETVAATLAAEPGACATAWYEAGELWRRHGSLAKAESAYGEALARDQDRFQGRALFQIAEMQRRQKLYDKAAASYRRAAQIDPGSARAHDARVAIARCLAAQGKHDEAVSAFRSALEAAERPRDVIEACNDLAKALVRAGDLDGARAAIEHAEKTVQGETESGGDDADRLQSAVLEMSSRKALQRALDKRDQAAKDAVDLERSREAPSVGRGGVGK
jgi:tetratricopeptide (TPR) repeat protein